MTKRRTKPPLPTAWIDALDLEEIAAACEEATVDANDEEEQLSGLITMAQETLEFLFPAKVMGQAVQVVESEWSERDACGLILSLSSMASNIALRCRVCS